MCPLKPGFYCGKELENVLKSMKEVWRREMDSDEELILDAVLYEFEWALHRFNLITWAHYKGDRFYLVLKDQVLHAGGFNSGK